MARTRRADYIRSNRIRTLSLSDPEEAARAAHRLLGARDALSRRVLGSDLLAVLAAQTGGFYARLRHLRDQIEAGAGDGLEETATVRSRRDDGSPLPLLERLWSIIRAL